MKLVLAALFVAAVHGLWMAVGDSVVAAGGFYDGDSYMRLLRVDRLLHTGGWFDNSLPRTNWPLGGTLHWSRLFDLLLIALALPMALVLGMAKALYWSGVLISPLVHVLAAVVMAWAVRPLLGRDGALIAGALTALQFGVLAYAVAGHADHHMLFGLLAVAAFGFVLRALADPENGTRSAVYGGGVMALSLWLGVESQVTLGLILAVLGLAWVAEGGGRAHHAAGFCAGLLGGLVMALLIERGPQGFFDVGYDRLSAVHVTEVLFVLLFWRGMVSGEKRRRRFAVSPRGRLIAGFTFAAGFLALMRVLFDKVFTHPFADNLVGQALLQQTYEAAAIDGLPHFLLYLGGAVLALPWALWRLRAEYGKPSFWGWLLIAAGIGLFTALSVNGIRWSLYAGLVFAVAVADMMAGADAALDRRRVFQARLFLKVPVMALLAVGPLVLGVGAVHALAQSERPGAAGEIVPGPGPGACSVKALAEFLNKPPWGDRPRAILASANFGPEIMYRTRHRVTATLHHTNAQGIADSAEILGGVEDAQILDLIGKRQVGLILLCPKTRHDEYLMKGGDDRTFYRRLERGDLPGWLAEVPLPADLGVSFKLFKVSPPG